MLCRVFLLLVLVIWCALNLPGVRCDVVLRGNGYTGITIALSPRIPPEGLPDGFAHTVAELVESASKKVYQDLNGRAFFKEVTLLVPSSLSASSLVDNSSSSGGNVEVTVSSRPTFGSAHFVIEPDKFSVFGEHPYTLQYGSCGVPGLRTVLPLSYVAHADGKAMAEEWYRLRYGVFSEESVPNTSEQYTEASVLKHGVQCGSRSAREVILKTDELSNVVGQDFLYQRVKLKVVKESPLRIVVVWNVEAKEPTQSQLSSTPYAPTLTALKKFAQVLVPDDAMMALVAYSTDMFYADSALISMKTKTEREQFAKSYPRSDYDPSRFDRAVDSALALLGSNTNGQSRPQGTILLITHDKIREDFNATVQKLADADVRVHALLLSRSNAGNRVEPLCLDNDGKVFLAEASENRALFYTHQANAMAGLVFSKTSYAETKAPMMLKQKIIEQVQPGQEVSEVFYVDSHTGVTLRVDMIYKDEDTGSDYINYVSLSSPTGKKYDARSKELSPQAFNVQQFKIESAAPGQWTLRVKPSHVALDPAKLEVWLAPTSVTDPLVSLNAWLSSSFTSVDPSKPFLVYAEVRKGFNPIRYVNVTATIIDPEGRLVELDLVDNGAGDPDITAGDGIYSRYFTGFSKKGHYKLSVIAEGTGDSVVVNGAVLDGGSSSPPRCCGSQFPESASVPTEPFSRYFEYGSFFSIQDRPGGDVYPPSRITDLKVSSVDPKDRRVTLEWTAPGNDYDQGAAKGYDIRYFERAVDFAPLFDSSGKKIDPFSIDGLAYSPKPFGEREKASFNVNCGEPGDSCYFAIRASDDSNNGPVSNVVEVQFPKLTPTIAPDGGSGGDPDGIGTGSDLDNDRNYARGGMTSLQLALAIVLPLLLLLILIIIIVLFICFRRRGEKKDDSNDSSPRPPTRPRPIISAPLTQNGSTPKKENGGIDDSTDKVNPYATSMYYGISPINSYSADYLMDVYEDEKAKRGHRTPTAPDKADLSSEAPSGELPPQEFSAPEGKEDLNDVGLPSVRPYVTELKPARSPPYGTESRGSPPGFSTEPRRQTFV